ncbi:hypothetical protein PBNK65E_000031100 [Plasmodium berghei]|uniref:Uncharacterized protein n=1 Tax=Plasmodium berghei TaxID=5821 RepID=A0A0Y9TT67_PLABE|nr:hypothetical protein PBK173_000033100 [Plasmodium berghei]SCL90431.1 hypothetical protein PBNK65NY_000030800 [Plasmodium berghei]SCM15298.1 hypothetical protein PBSP11A_000030900 [Plasmodium berghei]SCM17093.1 hypothetical protein PBSP11RLL_000031100 [Plasmodium berghei]SCN22018.1 hypothetical protein PBNK65E_000031100 [Plasmodium berghei]
MVKFSMKAQIDKLTKKGKDTEKKCNQKNDTKIYELKVTLDEIEIQTKGKFDDLTNNMPCKFGHISI